MLCSIAATRPGIGAVVSCVIYSLTVCGLFGISALYHRRVWSPRGYQIMRRLDHSMIFVFIAGTYTPFCVLLLPARHGDRAARHRLGRRARRRGAEAGLAARAALGRPRRSTSRSAGSRSPCCPTSCRHGGVTALVLLVVGGVAYSVGAVFYALRRPNPWPTVFGHHEFFHACTLVAAICHHIAIYFALLLVEVEPLLVRADARTSRRSSIRSVCTGGRPRSSRACTTVAAAAARSARTSRVRIEAERSRRASGPSRRR